MSRKRVLSESQAHAVDIMAIELERISKGTAHYLANYSHEVSEPAREFIGLLGRIARDGLHLYDNAEKE